MLITERARCSSTDSCQTMYQVSDAHRLGPGSIEANVRRHFALPVPLATVRHLNLTRIFSHFHDQIRLRRYHPTYLAVFRGGLSSTFSTFVPPALFFSFCLELAYWNSCFCLSGQAFGTSRDRSVWGKQHPHTHTQTGLECLIWPMYHVQW